ncbi:MAG: YigZ family protein [Firmicutes bacterium]|nr:YigZ family protein [Bacillota bacterium]
MRSYRTVLREGQDELVEKKSRFIGIALPVEDEAAAEARLAACRKQYWDASHCVYAYRIGSPVTTERSSDDGEPAHTAGIPILSLLQKEGIEKVMVMVIRYFGGTLLGTGGLVRAYSEAARIALAAGGLIRVDRYWRMSLELDYFRLGKVQYELAAAGIPVLSTDYGEKIRMSVLIPEDGTGAFIKKMADITDGALIPVREELVNAAELDGEWHFFP